MFPILAGVIAAVAGIAAGLALRGEVVRLSAGSGEPDHAACDRCAAPLPGRPALWCGSCGSWIGAPLALELTTAAVIGLLITRFEWQPVVAAYCYLGFLAVALTQIDIAARRLPDRLTLPAYPALLLLLALAATAGGAWGSFGRAMLGGLVSAGGYLLLSLLSGGQVGGGDIKLAGLAGLVLGWLSWHTLASGIVLGFVLAALVSAALLAARRVSRASRISFGPYLLSGAFLALLTAR